MIALVAALGKNRAIGHEGALLWYIPGDLPRFKELTMGHPIVMGRKTFESIGRPLPGRTNIVVSRSLQDAAVQVAGSVEEALAKATEAPGGDRVFVIGGGEIYTQTISHADRLYLTLVDDAPEADTFFPDYDSFDCEISRESFADSTPAFDYLVLERRPCPAS